jgi:hemerythrin superfamily protein
MTSDREDAVAFLERQHAQVRSVLSEIETSGARRAENFETLVRMLAVHETAEEMVVYPVVRASVPGGSALADARLAEEAAAKKMLADLEKLGADGPGFSEQFSEFAQAVRDHAEREEQEIFARLRERLEPGTLETMRVGLVAAEAVAPTHPHPRGPESATGNIVVGPFLSIVDRVRDALRSMRH